MLAQTKRAQTEHKYKRACNLLRCSLFYANIAPVKSAILIIYDWFNYLIINYLFPDAELREDVAEDLVRGYLSSDGAQMVEDVAELLAQQVGGAAGA